MKETIFMLLFSWFILFSELASSSSYSAKAPVEKQLERLSPFDINTLEDKILEYYLLDAFGKAYRYLIYSPESNYVSAVGRNSEIRKLITVYVGKIGTAYDLPSHSIASQQRFSSYMQYYSPHGILGKEERKRTGFRVKSKYERKMDMLPIGVFKCRECSRVYQKDAGCNIITCDNRIQHPHSALNEIDTDSGKQNLLYKSKKLPHLTGGSHIESMITKQYLLTTDIASRAELVRDLIKKPSDLIKQYVIEEPGIMLTSLYSKQMHKALKVFNLKERTEQIGILFRDNEKKAKYKRTEMIESLVGIYDLELVNTRKQEYIAAQQKYKSYLALHGNMPRDIKKIQLRSDANSRFSELKGAGLTILNNLIWEAYWGENFDKNP